MARGDQLGRRWKISWDRDSGRTGERRFTERFGFIWTWRVTLKKRPGSHPRKSTPGRTEPEKIARQYELPLGSEDAPSPGRGQDHPSGRLMTSRQPRMISSVDGLFKVPIFSSSRVLSTVAI